MIDFGYVQTAMVTPFNKELEIDFKTVETLVEHLIQNGTNTIVVAGTTGESPTLTYEEKMQLFSYVKEVAGTRANVVANAGSNSTKDSLDFTKEIERQGKADAIMLVNPYYNKPSQEGLYQHFSTIAANTKLPVMLYNIPGRTAVNATAETIIRLSDIPNIVAVKESSGDLSQMARIIQNTSYDFKLYSGDDNLTLPILSIGGDGVVSVASHVIGRKLKEMIESFFMGDFHGAGQLHREMLPVMEDLFFTTNPVPIKALLRKQGFSVGSVRLPLVDIEATQEEKIQDLHNYINTLNN